MEYVIRGMDEKDWSDVARIFQEGMDTNLARFETVCPAQEKFMAEHLPVGLLVIERGGRIGGWSALSAVSSRAVYKGVAEVSLYIGEDFRGQGLGRRLLERLIALSEEEGFWTLQSGIMADNTPSLKLHQRCGFRTVGLREKIGRDGHGVWRDVVLMERRSPKIM